MVQIAQFNQLDGSEVLRMIRISSLVSQAVAPLNYDSDLLQLTKVAIYKLPSVSISYCHNYPFATKGGCHGASTWSKKGQRCRVERRANSQWENQEKATIQMPPVIQKQNSCKLSFFFQRVVHLVLTIFLTFSRNVLIIFLRAIYKFKHPAIFLGILLIVLFVILVLCTYSLLFVFFLRRTRLIYPNAEHGTCMLNCTLNKDE